MKCCKLYKRFLSETISFQVMNEGGGGYIYIEREREYLNLYSSLLISERFVFQRTENS